MPDRQETEGRLNGVRVLVLFGSERIFGSELSNLEVFRTLEALGLKSRFITSGKWGHKEIQPALDRLGIEWTTAPFGYHWGNYIFGRYFYYFFFNIYGVVMTSWKLWREVKRWKPTHLYAPNWMHYSYAMPVIAWLRLPLVYRAGDELPLHTWFHRWIIGKLACRVNAVVCISRFIQNNCAAAGMAREKTRVIYNYPPHRTAGGDVALPAVPSGAVVLTYLGQVSRHKGVEVLLTAVEQMIGRGANLVLWVVGDSMYDEGWFDELKARAAAPSLGGRITFFGYVEKIQAVLSVTDIHVCPSLFQEPLSNVVGEAKLCGKPSVVFPSGGLPELIEHGVDGYICRDHSVGALVEGISYFATDEARRVAGGQAAKRSLETKFGLDRFRQQWMEVFLSTQANHE